LPCAISTRPDEAIAEYRKAIELDPRLAVTHYNLGLALRDQHKTDEAIAAYRKAIELDPRLALLHSNLGSELKWSAAITNPVSTKSEEGH
jgi:tetratricopeptide (TPR) repeat protein